jgi:leucyl aminopeptidase
MQIGFHKGNCREVACDILGCMVFEEETAGSPALRILGPDVQAATAAALASGEFKAELHRVFLLHKPKGLKAAKLLLIGAGRESDFTPARQREIAGTLIRRAKGVRAKSVTIATRGNLNQERAARIITEGVLYGNYESDVYKTRDREGDCVEQFLILVGRGADAGSIHKGILHGTAVGEATNFIRTLSNEPSNVLTPSEFAERATVEGKRAGLSVEVLEREEMQKLGMNTLLAVARGSDEPPKMVILRWEPQKPRPGNKPSFRALVGKGVTFDSGGISIKPADKMEDMKADMSGGAAVLGAMLALARLNHREPVLGLIPLVENLPSGRAMRPGDVVKSYLGKTVEIINTDAEGRLILADALAYAKHLGAASIIDLATLTGACVVALGHVNAGMMGTDQATMDRLRANCAITGEKLWQLPLDDEYRKLIRSEIADMKNIGNRWGGAITAAKFLQEFVEQTPWVHLDIAGVDLDHDGRPFAAKGATGFGVRTLVQLLSACQ